MWKILLLFAIVSLTNTQGISRYVGTCISHCSVNTPGITIGPHCSSCSKYVVCMRRYLYNLSCPPGQLFDKTSLSCRPAALANCRTRRAVPVSPVPATSPRPVARRTPSTPFVCRPLCYPGETGIYQSCRGCNWILNCRMGSPHYILCPGSMRFDSRYRRCSWNSPTCREQD